MLDLSLFQSPFPNVYILEKWNWDYLEAQSFQLQCVEYVQEHPQVAIFIFCSHPHCFTMGRGLQKTKDPLISLIEFDRATTLPFPLYDIKRGGGLTFHYPGQLVLYPIMSTTHHKIPVYDLMIKILEFTQNALSELIGFSGTIVRKDLLGLWARNDFIEAKIASIGLAASRFVTYHGLALNLNADEEMFHALRQVYPCGINGALYSDVESLNGTSNLEFLKNKLVYKMIDQLQVDILSNSTQSNTLATSAGSMSTHTEIC